uniref:Dual specificity phosphatase 22 n=1 Tax=Felis catus TaxID=9685 RepID=A0ABI7ZTZ0_FELCA
MGSPSQASALCMKGSKAEASPDPDNVTTVLKLWDSETFSRNLRRIFSFHHMLSKVERCHFSLFFSPYRTRHFKESIKFIHECRLRGEGCLVHCLAGVSRSVTLVIAYIMTVTDFGWEDALHTVRAGRSCANPNLGFQRQLQEFEKHEVHQYRQWLKEEYGESPLRDAEEAKNILATIRRRPNNRVIWCLPFHPLSSVHFCWVPWNTDCPHGGQEREGGEGGSRLLLHEPTPGPFTQPTSALPELGESA